MTTVLVVEDELNIRKFVSANLKARGFQVLEAPDAETGVAIIQNTIPDAIVLDIKLPGMDGWQFLNTITERYPQSSNIPVILVTATVVEEGYRQDKYRNIVDVLLKPFEMSDLTSAIDRALMTRSKS